MALFNKLFFSSSNKRKAINTNQSQHYLSQFPFNTDQVRVLLYRECDNRGRRLLFDSNAIEKVDLKKCDPDKMKSFGVEGKSNKKHDHQFLFNSTNNAGFIEISDGFAYKHSRPNSSDITGIGEMIFGALAMSFRGTALKIHWLQSPVRILCSQVFLTPLHSKLYPGKDSSGNMSSIYTSSAANNSSEDSSASFTSLSMPFSVCVNKNLNLLSEKDSTNCVTVPNVEMSLESVQLYSTLSGEDSGYSGGNDPWASSTDCQYSQFSTRSSLGSVFDDPESIRKLSIDSTAMTTDSNRSSEMSLKRRISRNISTSFENRNSMSDLIGFIGDNYQTATGGGSDGCVSRYRYTNDAHDSRSNPEMIRNRGAASKDSFLGISSPSRQIFKRPKLGLAVCITMTEHFEKEMEQFCCEHIALFESMLCRLRASAENAYINHRNFLQIMVSAWQSAAKWVQDLFTAPRVHSPVWLNINGDDTKKTKNLAETFMKELTWLLSFADTKDTNFFISTMLTALLTYHLGWVSTITAFKSQQYSQLEDLINEQKAKMLEISHKHPYNALWAQMGDLYGSIGNPPRISRTIIYGTENHIIEKLLHVLTYFIRCESIKRTSKIKIIDNKALNDVIEKKNNTQIQNKSVNKRSGLTRSPTCLKNLLQTEHCIEQEEIKGNEERHVKNHLMNDISNVLMPDSSHFIQQELKIENLNMNMNGLEKTKNEIKHNKSLLAHDKIRFTVTTPENIELAVNYSESENSTLISSPLSYCNVAEEESVNDVNFQHKKFSTNDDGTSICPSNGMEDIKNDVRLEDIKNVQESKMNIDKNGSGSSGDGSGGGLRKSVSMSHLSETVWKSTHTNLSDLITVNNVLGIESQKEMICEEQQNFELKNKLLEKKITPLNNYFNRNKSKSAEGVVFVLGDNEALVNIKKSNEDMTVNDVKITSSSSSLSNLENQATRRQTNVNEKEIIEERGKQQCCCHHKKHSGVKFNFEKYPQIATNYMKNKNLDLSSYDFLDKSSKFEEYFKFGPSTSAFHVMTLPKSNDGNDETKISTTTINITANDATAVAANDSCEVCKYCSSVNDARVFQTPSNATELEFETEDDKFPMKTTTITGIEAEISGGGVATATAVVAEAGIVATAAYSNTSSFAPSIETIAEENEIRLTSIKADNDVKENPLQGFTVLERSNKFDLVQLPLPGVEDQNSTCSSNKIVEITPGFVPSLLVGVSDHYIPDMVLQGITTSPNNWEIKLKQDLVLSSHCATLMPTPVENVAIIADMSKWDVKVMSSQNSGLPHKNGSSGNPIGMSQLVSTMLETVYTMSCSGISAYECLSYIESKLQEMYLQSETLAAFLLATEFCSLNTVTKALNLSANDVPLLLSVASVHSPQVTRKYGISTLG